MVLRQGPRPADDLRHLASSSRPSCGQKLVIHEQNQWEVQQGTGGLPPKGSFPAVLATPSLPWLGLSGTSMLEGWVGPVGWRVLLYSHQTQVLLSQAPHSSKAMELRLEGSHPEAQTPSISTRSCLRS